jgi:hypothetical protein
VKNFSKQKWPAVLFFLTSGFIFFGCVWYLWAGATNPEYYWQASSTPTKSSDTKDHVFGKKDRIMLAKDHGAMIDEERIVYRGQENGMLHLDLFILQLDPHYGYPHRIPDEQARDGFRIGSHQFKVLAVSDGKVSLKRF